MPRRLDPSWKVTAIVSRACELAVDDHRRRRVGGIEEPHFLSTPMTFHVVVQNVSAQNDQGDGQRSPHRKLKSKYRVREKDSAQHQQRDAPSQRIAVQLARDGVFFSVRRQSGAHQLCRAAGINRGKEPSAEHAKRKVMKPPLEKPPT